MPEPTTAAQQDPAPEPVDGRARLASALRRPSRGQVVAGALLAVLGPRVDRWRVFRHREAPAVGTGFWHRMAMAVMRRPLVVTVAVVGLLIFLGLPFFGANFGTPDHRVLPEGNPAREVSEHLEADFASAEANAFPAGLPVGIVHWTEAGAPEVELFARLDRLDLVRLFDYGLGGILPPEAVARPEPRPQR